MIFILLYLALSYIYESVLIHFFCFLLDMVNGFISFAYLFGFGLTHYSAWGLPPVLFSTWLGTSPGPPTLRGYAQCLGIPLSPALGGPNTTVTVLPGISRIHVLGGLWPSALTYFSPFHVPSFLFIPPRLHTHEDTLYPKLQMFSICFVFCLFLGDTRWRSGVTPGKLGGPYGILEIELQFVLGWQHASQILY